jgi:hypothetical protein
MDKISAKQVEGVVDVSSQQSIEGEKTFLNPISIVKNDGRDYSVMCMDGLFLYWLVSPGVLEADGNKRIGINPISGRFGAQEFMDGTWYDIEI